MAKSDKDDADRAPGTGGDAAAAPARRRRKAMPGLGAAEMSDLEQSAVERVEPARAAFESAGLESANALETQKNTPEPPPAPIPAPPPPTPHQTPPMQAAPAATVNASIEEKPIMSEAAPSSAVPPAAPIAHDGMAAQLASAKSLAGSALGMAILAAVIAGVAVIFGPIPAMMKNERQQAALEMQQMQARLVKQEREGRALALALAVEQVKAAAVRPGPFDGAIGGLAAVTAGDVDAQRLLDGLRPLARSGVASLRQLKDEYSSLVGPVLVASSMPGDPHWMKQAVAKVTGWTAKISAQLPIETYSPATHATLDRAADALDHDALKDAITTLKSLDGSAQAMLQPWLAAANRRLSVDETLNQLSVLASTRLASARS